MDYDSVYVYLKSVPPIAVAVFYDFPKVIPMLYNQYMKHEFPKEYLQQLLYIAITHNRVKCAQVILNLGAKAIIPNYRVERFNYRHVKCQWHRTQSYSDDDYMDYDEEPPYFNSKSSNTSYLKNFEIMPPLFISKSAEMTKLLIRYGADPLEFLIKYDDKSTLPEISEKGLRKLVHDKYKYGYSNKKIPEDKMKDIMDITKKEIKEIDGAFVETNITAFHYAIEQFKPEIVMVLLERIRDLEKLDHIFGKDINGIISGYMGTKSVAEFKQKFDYLALLPALTLDISRNSTKIFVNPETGMSCAWHKHWHSSNETLQISRSHNIGSYNNSQKHYSINEYYNIPYSKSRYLRYDDKTDTFYEYIRYIMPEFKNSVSGFLVEWNKYETNIYSYIPSSKGRFNLNYDIKYDVSPEAITISHEGTWKDLKKKWRNEGICIESIKDIFGTYTLARENNLASIQEAMEQFFTET